MQTVERATGGRLEEDPALRASKKVLEIKASMFKVLEEKGIQGFEKFLESYRLMLAYGVIASMNLKDEISSGSELSRIEGWRTARSRDSTGSTDDDATVRAIRERVREG
jgi:hypothetical protein